MKRGRLVTIGMIATILVASAATPVAATNHANSTLAWAHALGGTSFEAGLAVAVDGFGNTYLTGYFGGAGVDFDPDPVDEHLLDTNGGEDIFLAKYGTDGDLAWAHGIGGVSVDTGIGIAVDGSGNVYITGYFQGSDVDFDPDPIDEHLLTSNGSADIFVAKYHTAGDLDWAHNIGGTGFDDGAAIAVDGSGNTYVTGSFAGSDVDFDPDPVDEHLLTSNGAFDVFMAKYDTAGNLEWAYNIGGTSSEEGSGIAVDDFGTIYLTGYFLSAGVDFDPDPVDEHPLTSNGDRDVFVAKYDTDGTVYWAHNIGGTGPDQARGIAVDSAGASYLTGFFGSSGVDFDPDPVDEHVLTNNGLQDAFVLKLDEAVPSPTVGLFDPSQGQWHLRNSTGSVTSFYFGNPGDYPIMGDWDCDGVDTVGMYRQSNGMVYLRNSNDTGNHDIRFFFGNPADIPIVGDFDDDGCDTVSIYRPSNQTFYIINALGANDGSLGAAEFSYIFGNPGDKPFVGDFDGDGTDTVGLHREPAGWVYFRNSHSQGNADGQFFFGNPNDRFVAGDWDSDGIDSPGVFRPSNTTFYFRYTNTQGNADEQFGFGQPGWLPVSGVFGLG